MILSEFLDKWGITFDPILNGTRHDYKGIGQTKKKSWYIGSRQFSKSGKEYITITCGNYVTGEKESWFPNGSVGLTDEEIKELRRKADEDAQKALEQKTQTQEAIALEAKKIWEEASTEDGSHPYLQKKCVPPFNLKRSGAGELLIPCIDSEFKLWGLQKIDANGGKRFLFGQKKSGLFCILPGTDQSKTYLAEGFATAASITCATNCPAIICFDAHNLVEVAKLFPKAIVCADDDAWKEKNVGVEAAAKTGLSYIVPDFSMVPAAERVEKKPTDFNDLHVLLGLSEVTKQLSKTLTAPILKAEILPKEETKEPSLIVANDSLPKEISQKNLDLWMGLGLTLNKNKAPIANLNNVALVLSGVKELCGCIWFDEFHNKIFMTWGGPFREWGEVDTLKLLQFLQKEVGLTNLTEKIVYQAIIFHAHHNKKNAPLDYCESLKWDGVHRVEGFFINYFGADPTLFNTCASKNFWVSMVARIYQPGCKVDNMVILEGNQGRYKSTALDAIGKKWFAEVHTQVGSKDFFQELSGKVLVEISELEAFSRAEANTVKKVVSCRVDRYRPSYGKHAEDFPRRCIFVGTTNDPSYLKDSTGARRFWPVKTGKIEIEKIREDREQLFAEAVTLYKEGSTWWEVPEKEAEELTEQRYQKDPWEEIIRDYCLYASNVTIKELLTGPLSLTVDRLKRFDEMRVATILKRIGWEKTRDQHHRFWVKKEA